MNLSVLIPAFISFQEITVILIIAVVIFGPKKIPEIARGLGEGVRAMKKATEDIKREIMNPVDDINPVKDIQDGIKDIQQTVEEAAEDVADSANKPVKDFKESIDSAIGPIKRE